MKKKLEVAFLLGVLLLVLPLQNVVAKKVLEKTPTNKQLKTEIKQMTLDEKIGQMYVISSTGDVQQAQAAIKDYHLGGIALFGTDFENQTRTQFKQKTAGLQKSAQIPLLIGTDQEGGEVSRLSQGPNFTNKREFPAPQEVYQEKGLKGVTQEAKQTAKILHDLGVNWNFAPVADVTQNKDSFIYARTLGKGYKKTGKYVGKVVETTRKQKLATSLKHFPGYGSTDDTHTGIAKTDRSLKDFKKNDFIPFKAGIDKGADSVMVSHIIISDVDPKLPASLSPKVHHLLRQDLNFKKVIVSDDLSMGAIKDYSKQHKIKPDVAAVKAGNDILLSSSYADGIPAIKEAIQNKQISEKNIDRSVYRILKMKRSLGMLKDNRSSAMYPQSKIKKVTDIVFTEVRNILND